MAVVKFACLVVLCTVVVAPYAAEAAISCVQVQGALAPCINYLKNGGVVPPKCCTGVISLNAAAKTTPERQQACKCLQSASTSIPGIKPPFATSLPSKCGVSVAYKISPSTDCSKVK